MVGIAPNIPLLAASTPLNLPLLSAFLWSGRSLVYPDITSVNERRAFLGSSK